MEGILYIENFIQQPEDLFDFLTSAVQWDDRMAARKTASYGKAYNYSQIDYPYQEFLPELAAITLIKPIFYTRVPGSSLSLWVRREP